MCSFSRQREEAAVCKIVLLIIKSVLGQCIFNYMGDKEHSQVLCEQLMEASSQININKYVAPFLTRTYKNMLVGHPVFLAL